MREPLLRRTNILPMVQGCEESHPPGMAISTDRQCNNRDFCDFYDSGASGSDAVQGDTFICIGCNDTMERNTFSLVDWDTIKRSRDEQKPGGWD